jgi:hypothetical protein
MEKQNFFLTIFNVGKYLRTCTSILREFGVAKEVF